MDVKNRKKLSVGVILILIGAGLIYLGYLQQKNSDVNPIENKRSDTDSITHSNSGSSSEVGEKPETSLKDGSVKVVEEFIKSNAKNPSSLQFLEWSDVSKENGYWKVRCKYTGVSSFNAEVTTNAWFYIRKNKVIYTKIISKI